MLAQFIDDIDTWGFEIFSTISFSFLDTHKNIKFLIIFRPIIILNTPCAESGISEPVQDFLANDII